MSKLGELHREEIEAQQELEKAEKEAQKIRMSIQDLLDSQNVEIDEQLKKITRLAEEEVEKKIIVLSNSLRGETEEKLNRIAEKKEILERAATASLREYILSSGSSSR
jgi:galactitol-specific phosphotransferase system IIB component